MNLAIEMTDADIVITWATEKNFKPAVTPPPFSHTFTLVCIHAPATSIMVKLAMAALVAEQALLFHNHDQAYIGDIW